jgi:hypothetical protein
MIVIYVLMLALAFPTLIVMGIGVPEMNYLGMWLKLWPTQSPKTKTELTV